MTLSAGELSLLDKGYKTPLKFNQVTHKFLVFSSSLGVAINLKQRQRQKNDIKTSMIARETMYPAKKSYEWHRLKIHFMSFSLNLKFISTLFSVFLSVQKASPRKAHLDTFSVIVAKELKSKIMSAKDRSFHIYHVQSPLHLSQNLKKFPKYNKAIC